MLVSTIGLARYLLFLLAGMLCAFLLGAIPVGVIVGKRHLVIRFPEGSTIDIPKDSVGTEQIINGGVKQEDLDPDIEAGDQDIDNIFTNQ